MKKTPAPKIILKASTKLIFEKATLHGFFKNRNDKFIAIRVARCVNLNHLNILRYYNFVIYSVFNYYSFADNRNFLRNFARGLNLSCARTLALNISYVMLLKFIKNLELS